MQTAEPVRRVNAANLFVGRTGRLLRPAEPALRRLFLLDQLRRAFDAAGGSAGDGQAFTNLLAALRVNYSVSPGDLARIPARGPVVVAANHPFGLLEGAILGALLPGIRPDFKFLANSMLDSVPALRDQCIFVNPFGGSEAVAENRMPLQRALEWLRGGGMLVVFPSGEVAHLDWKQAAVTDPPWNPVVARLIRLAGCPALPVFFLGANSLSFQLLGALHPRLRTVNLPRELLNKRGRNIELRVGRPVSPAAMRAFSNPEQAIEYLRCRTHLLVNRSGNASRPKPKPWRAPLPSGPAVPAALLAGEIGSLDGSRRLAESEELSVYLAGAAEVPHVLQEIGRLRELTFRSAGEGTGKAADLDRFDTFYSHLFIWSRDKSELVGAYRLGATPDILPVHGLRGLYTSSLFRLHPEFFRRIGPAIELGRSFIRPEYQRQYAPLLLLWKGIGQYVIRRPELPVLFGAVSISNDYNPVSRDLLARYLDRCKAADLARFVRPRSPYRRRILGTRQTDWLSRFLGDVAELSDPIADLEPDGKGIPILIKQYMKLGGRTLGFNVDSRFSDALDGLILLDLRQTPPPVLGRYISSEGAAAFLEYHRKEGGARFDRPGTV
jgi:putative hemolysin